MLVEKGYRAATLSDRRCPVLSVVVGWDVAPMWPQGTRGGMAGADQALSETRGPERPLVPGSAAPLRAAQSLGVELDGGGAVGGGGDMGHEEGGCPRPLPA